MISYYRSRVKLIFSSSNIFKQKNYSKGELMQAILKENRCNGLRELVQHFKVGKKKRNYEVIYALARLSPFFHKFSKPAVL